MGAKREAVKQWLMALNQEWGLNCLVLNSENQCHLQIGKHELSFSLSDDEQELVLWSPVYPIEPFLKKTDLLVDLLALNYNEASLAGSTISIDKDHRQILISYRASISQMDAHSLGDLLCNFNETVPLVENILSDITASKRSHIEEPYQSGVSMHITRP